MTLLECLQTVNLWLWSGPLLILLLLCGVYLTYLLRGFQIRFLGVALREVFAPTEHDNAEGDISRFQALMTSLAGAIGTGSIVGVATAVVVGGVGSLVWMWLAAFIGMATKYAESLLAVHYRQSDERGEMIGGPMHYIDRGMGCRWLALFFAAVGSLAAVTTGNLIQINAIAESAQQLAGISPLISGVVVFLLSAFVIIGGVKTIGKVASLLVPIMALFYVCTGLLIIGLHIDRLPEAISLIINSAFTGQAATGAFIGSSMIAALQMGVARSVLTSEAGLGISSIAAAAAITDRPARQAMVTMTGALFSTLLVCTITTLVLCVTQVLGSEDGSGQQVDGATLAITAFARGVPFGYLAVTTGLLLFAFTTILAWGYYGEKCFEYIVGERGVMPWRIFFVLCIIPGALLDVQLIWQMADFANSLMVLPNLIALLILAPVVKEETELFIDHHNGQVSVPPSLTPSANSSGS